MKKYGFFINNYNFQLFMTLVVCLMEEIPREDAVLYCNSQLEKARCCEELEKYIEIGNRLDEYEFETAYFFTAVYPSKEQFSDIKCKHKILVYEGLTTCYARHYASCFDNWEIDDFEKIIVPDLRLVCGKDKALYEELNCREWFAKYDNLKKFTEIANIIFQYDSRITDRFEKYTTYYMDRYFDGNSRIINDITHRLITVCAVSDSSADSLIKLHPYEMTDFYYEKMGFNVEKDPMPYELIYANMILNNPSILLRRDKYYIYNSSSAVNVSSMFGNDNIILVCLGELLDRYGDGVDESYVSSRQSKIVLNNLANSSHIKVIYPKNVQELINLSTNCDTSIFMKNVDEEWSQMESRVKRVHYCDSIELRAIRLQIEMTVCSIGKNIINYYASENTISKHIVDDLFTFSEKIKFIETDDQEKADLLIDCNHKWVNYCTDIVDVHNIYIIDNCIQTTEDEERIYNSTRDKKNIFLWGATSTNIRTYSALTKFGFEDRIVAVIDSKATECEIGIPVVKFDEIIVGNNDVIIICANLAHKEISDILTKKGYMMNKDYIYGVALNM